MATAAASGAQTLSLPGGMTSSSRQYSGHKAIASTAAQISAARKSNSTQRPNRTNAVASATRAMLCDVEEPTGDGAASIVLPPPRKTGDAQFNGAMGCVSGAHPCLAQWRDLI